MKTSTTPSLLGSSEVLIPLTFLRTGQSGCVGDVVGSGGLVQRLREMGLRAGARVRMLRSGSPCILSLDGQKLCIRSDEMSHVLVRV